jgi:regulator of sigma E protease
MDTTLFIEIGQFVGALAALIIIHELGHFVVARLFNIEVEEFGLGFPPRLATLFEAGGTKYTLNWIPLGGFVRPKGENDPEVPGGLAAASPWVRLAVLAAGPLANLLVGVLLYTIILSRIGAPIRDQVQIIEVAPNSPAQQAGLRAGDLILEVGEQDINSTDDLQSTIHDRLGEATAITFQRDGQVQEVVLTPREDPPEGEGAIGIVMSNPTRPVSLLEAFPRGVLGVFQHGRQILAFPVQMIRGDVSPEEGRFVGFKGMFDIYQEVRQSEPGPIVPAGVQVLGFFATITISLGILNLLPIPALDGGRILFVLPEIVIGRRIPQEYENVINLVSFALLLVLLLYINLQDFVNPIELPR